MALPQTGLLGAEQALEGGLMAGLSSLRRGAALTGRFLNPFSQPGGQAFGLQADLSGAAGAPAQQQAFDNFISSPGQQFLRDRGEQALLRNASATGGLGGGNVLSALQEQGIGFAAQDFGNQFNRLGSLSQIGAGAAGQQASTANQLNQLASNLFSGTGQNLAAGRTRAGEQIASNISGTGSALSQLINQQGLGTGQALQQGSGSLASLLAGGGQTQAQSQQGLATLLANIATQSAAQNTALPGIPSLQSKKGFLPEVATAAASVALSDERLKKNIRKIGETTSGLNLYTWDWNKLGRKLTGMISGVGVIAQEVQKIIPAAIVDDGPYLKVDYRKVF